MKWSFTVAALAIAASPLLAQAPESRQAGRTDTTAKRPVTLQGCVISGADQGTVALKTVTEIAEPGRSVMPAEAHGRRVVFWLTPDTDLAKHTGHMVQVRGETGKIEKSEIELKAGHQKSGGLVAEFEGPGKDVKVSHDAIGSSIGTAGRTTSSANDVKTFLIHVDVKDVTALEGTCR